MIIYILIYIYILKYDIQYLNKIRIQYRNIVIKHFCHGGQNLKIISQCDVTPHEEEKIEMATKTKENLKIIMRQK